MSSSEKDEYGEVEVIHYNLRDGLPEFLVLPKELRGASVDVLAERYIHLSKIKAAGEVRIGRHPAGYNNPADVEPSADVREVLEWGLWAVVRQMAAVMHEINQRPGGMTIFLPDGPWKNNLKPQP